MTARLLLGWILAALAVIAAPVANATGPGDDDAFIHALTAGPGVRESIAFVQSRSRDDLVEAGTAYCGGLMLGEGSIESTHDLLGVYGFTGHQAMAVAHAAGEVYCPDA